MFVFVIDNKNKLLMPCTARKAKILLKKSFAKIINLDPFTIKLIKSSTKYTQKISLGVAAGSKFIGVSAATKKEVLFEAEVQLRKDIKKLLSIKRKNRRFRRSRKTRYRKCRFLNRKKKDKWLAPSIKHKVLSHLKIIDYIHKILPVTKIIIEIAQFDIQKIKNSIIAKEEYQEDQQLNFYNTREYIFYRDNHTCQLCKKKNQILNVHHIQDRKTEFNAHNNLITLCVDCHKKIHLNKSLNTFIKIPCFKDASQIITIRQYIYKVLKEKYLNVLQTYGYITKNFRIKNNLKKSHRVNARSIIKMLQKPLCHYQIKQVRKNNRRLHKNTILKGNIRKKNIAPRLVKGFQLFDKILYNNATGFVMGRRSSGYFKIETIDGKILHASINYKKLKLLEKAKTFLTIKRSGISSPTFKNPPIFKNRGFHAGSEMKKIVSFLCIFLIIIFLYHKKFKNKNPKPFYQNKIEVAKYKPKNQSDKTLKLSVSQANNNANSTNDLSLCENIENNENIENENLLVQSYVPQPKPSFENDFMQEKDIFSKNLENFITISNKNKETKKEDTDICEKESVNEKEDTDICEKDIINEEDNKVCEEISSQEEKEEDYDLSLKKLSQISVINNRYTKESLLLKRIKFKPGDYINQQKLQQHLNFINLNPFRKVEAILENEKNNKCRLELPCHDRFLFRPYLGTDNTGLKLIDRERIYAGFNLNNAFNIDSILSYQYIASYDFKTFQAHTANYSIYLPWENIFTIFGVYADIDVDHNIPTIEKNNGFNLQASARYDICLPILSNLMTHDLILGFDFKRTDTNLLYSDFIATDDTTVNLTQVLLAYNLNWQNSFYKIKFLLEYYLSLGDWLPDQSDTRYNNLRTFAEHNYLYVRAELCNLFKLPKDFLFSLILKGQAANKNLLPSEMLGVGGYNSVRGYYERETNGDLGVIINAELRSPSVFLLRKVKDSFSFLLFADYGLASLHKATSSEEKNQHLVSFGPGFRYTIKTHLAARFDWGIRGKKSTQNERENSLIHFSVNLSY